MIIMNGTITLVEPLSISLGKSDYGGFPMINRYSGGSVGPTGFLPATTLRGRLRRGHVMRLMQEAAEAGQHFSLKKAYSELIGQDSVLDLFGSGLGIASRLRVSNFFPAENILPEKMQTFRKDLDGSEENIQSLTDEDKERFYNRKDLNSRRSKWESNIKTINQDIAKAKKKKEVTTELEATLKEAGKKLQEVKEEMGDMMQVSSLLPIEWHVLPPGLVLHGKIVVTNHKDTDMAILEDGLNSLSLDPVLGAASARGCGEIEGAFQVSINGEDKKTISFGGYKPVEITNF